MQYTIITLTENKPGVLYRMADLFLRRKVNIESLTVSEIESRGISRFTILVNSDKDAIDKIVKQLYKIVEVVKVYECTNEELIFKELAFFKVSTKTPERRREVENLAYLFRAKIVFVGKDFLVVEKTGTEEEIDSLLLLLSPYGMKEFARSGRIAISKEDKKLEGKNIDSVREVSDIASSIEVSAIKKIELAAKQEPGSISLAQGIPSFFTAPHIRKAAHDAIDNDLVDKYSSGYGIDPLRNAVVEKLKRDNNIVVDPSQVMVTHGGIEALMATFIALLNPHDELIIFTPDYASHITQTQIVHHGGRPIFVPLTETKDNWVLDADRFRAAVTPNTKAILLCNPCNPTGKVYTKEELKEIAQLAIDYNLFIITDEMYEYYTFDGKEHISIGSFPEVADRVISIFGLSKSYAMTGWRIGYLTASKKLVSEIFKIHDSLVTCPVVVSQYAGLAALTGDQSIVTEYKNAFLKRRKIVLEALNKTDKLSWVVPQGGYYIFPKFEKKIDDYEFSMQLLKDAKVAVVPGSAFGVGGESHVRISFGGDEEKLKIAVKRFVEYINKEIR